MHDIKAIRDNPTAFDSGLARRGLAPRAEGLIALDETRRTAILDLQRAQERRNAASKEIGAAMARKDAAAADALKAEVAGLKASMPELEEAERGRTSRSTRNSRRSRTFPSTTCPTARTRGKTSRCADGVRRPRSPV